MEDQERVRRDLLVQFKIELDQTKEELEKKHAENLKEEIEKLSEKHQRELAVAKKKQWCWQCNSEVRFYDFMIFWFRRVLYLKDVECCQIFQNL